MGMVGVLVLVDERTNSIAWVALVGATRLLPLFDAAVVGAAAIGAVLAPVGLVLLGLSGTLVALGLVCPLSVLTALRPAATHSVPSPA
jgi:hypothetical protein